MNQANHQLLDAANKWMQDPAKLAVVQQMKEDLDWAREHYRELDQQYHGETIAVWKKAVVAHGTDEGELVRQAATTERPREELVFIEFPAFFEIPH
jgi:hypothetical protein